ncbi:MAG: VWA domain-containing protein [Acidobacteria bacterium ACB1]|nr:VWA domain-containing protein [Acidobacteria bacterium ACB1]
MKIKFVDIGLIIVAFLVLANSAFAQGDKKDKTSTRIRTNVLVVNEKNEPVNDVAPSEIKVFENGVEQRASVMKLDGGLDLALVIDNTGSVRKQMDTIVKIGKALVDTLRPSDQATVIRFVGRDAITQEAAWTNERSTLNTTLDDLFVEGGRSAVNDAVYLAASELIKRAPMAENRRYAIVLISDGEDRDSFYSESDLLKLIEGTPVQVFPITLSMDLPKGVWDWEPDRRTVGEVSKFVNRIAFFSGGTSYILGRGSSPDDISNALKYLTSELQAQYLVSYHATNTGDRNKVRNLSVTVADGPKGEKRKALVKRSVVMIKR